jgi:prevent-host-death family protein
MAKTEAITSTLVRRELKEVMHRAQYGGARVLVTNHGTPAVAIISAADLALLEELEALDDLRAARAAAKEARSRGTRTMDEMKAELDLA